jgi:hypothetical protein
MRITVMKQMAKGLTKEGKAPAETGSEQAGAPERKSIEKELQSLKWNLWHGNVERALERIEGLQLNLELTAGGSENRDKLLKQLREFDGYIQNNREFIPNYGERYRNGERISTGFVESTVNQVVSKRMVKKQQMAWTERQRDPPDFSALATQRYLTMTPELLQEASPARTALPTAHFERNDIIIVCEAVH